MCGIGSLDSADPDGRIGPDAAGISGRQVPDPAGCSPVCTTAAADLLRIRRPVFVPGLWMQISR